MPKSIPASDLKRYADLVIKVGLNLQEGQQLALTGGGSGPTLHTFMRLVAESAYQAGASYVDAHYVDEQINLIRMRNAHAKSLDYYPDWQRDRILSIIADGGAMLNVSAGNPNLFSGEDVKRLSQMNRSRSRVRKPISNAMARGSLNWLNVVVPSRDWAAQVFPEVPVEDQQLRLWKSIYEVLRLNETNPETSWQYHINELVARSAYMTGKQYDALSFKGPGTDLTVGLVPNHLWQGGRTVTENGIEFTPNIPTEEIFSLPHRERCEGVVHGTKPISLQGMLVEEFVMTFHEGRVVKIKANKGQELLEQLLEADEGARRLGEIALVPATSPISSSGMLFLNTLFDENAASHFALGQAYNMTHQDGLTLSNDEFIAEGGNDSSIHVDFMIGSNEVDVDGITSSGRREPLMRGGEWAYDI